MYAPVVDGGQQRGVCTCRRSAAQVNTDTRKK
ncbi:hypothetical protein A2U01_0059353, partial [Trifolium medium]|nr:hypothetical protein [Trifolium medium]